MNQTTHHLLAGIALLLAGLFLAAALLLGAPQATYADPGVRYAAPAAQGNGDCTSWDHACTLQTALVGAVSGDEIWVKKGVHYPGTDRLHTFTLKNGVALYGGFAGTETERSQRDWQTNVAVLSGDIDRNDIIDPDGVVTTAADIVGVNAYHVVTGGSADSTAVLDGLVITAGQANDNNSYPNGEGGGMRNPFNSNPTISNVVFSGNTALRGGGMHNYSSSPALNNVAFRGNTATQNGGGMYNTTSSNALLLDVTFHGNTAQHGGGIYSYQSDMALTDVTFSGNLATNSGGGMYIFYGSPALANVVFKDNVAAAYGGGIGNTYGSPAMSHIIFSNNVANIGGGMHTYYGAATLTDVTFSGNVGQAGGGGMYNYASSLALLDVVFSRNTSPYDGGGIQNYNNSNATLINVIFSGNDGRKGGGIYNHYSSPTLINVSFSGNTANVSGGGMHSYYYSNPTVTNAILWENSAPDGQEISCEVSSTPSIAYSNIRACGGSGAWNSDCGSDGGGNIDADPRFIDAANGNLRLGFGSPAIDTGASTGCPATDLDGNPRPNDGNGDEIVICDMGAYEAGTMVAVEPVLPGGPPYEFEGQPGVSIEIHDLGGRANGALAWLYVDGMGVDHPHATDEMTSGQYWLIRGLQADGVTDASGFLATLTLPHDLPDHTAAHACRFDGVSSWDCARSDSSAGSVVRTDVTQFSDWTVSNGMPLAVTLSSFTAQVQGDHVLVAWETLSEFDTLGFNLWRGLAADGSDRELLTFVPSQSPGSTQGAVYQVQDAAVQAGYTYWYWLEDIDLSGQTTLHGPVSATMPAPTAVRLAGVDPTPASSPAMPATAVAVVVLAGLALLASLRRWQMMRR